MVAVASSVAVLSPYLQLCAGVGGFPVTAFDLVAGNVRFFVEFD